MTVILPENRMAEMTVINLRPDWADLSITHLVDNYLLGANPAPRLLAKVLAYCPPHYSLAVLRRLIELRQANRITMSQFECWHNAIENGIIEVYCSA